MYLPNDQYNKIVDALANLKPCPFAGKVTRDQVTIALGDVGDIWPVKIMESKPDARAESDVPVETIIAEMEIAQDNEGSVNLPDL